MPSLSVSAETWPIAGRFTLSRESRSEARVIVVSVTDGGHGGRGECVPYPRYRESVESVAAALEAMVPAVAAGLTRERLIDEMPAGAARNALDCALWDLESRRSGQPVWRLAGLPPPQPVTTAFTISFASPEEMADKARAVGHLPLLKLKLGGDGDDARIAAVRAAAPQARLVVDANEAWTPDHLAAFGPVMAQAGVELIEQPLPAGEDAALEGIPCPVPLCADESFHGPEDLGPMAGRYGAVNLKLDKAGGLTQALRILKDAQAANLTVFLGCMVSTSLAIAPALLMAGAARYVDLDGAFLLARDRVPGLSLENGRIAPAPHGLWGDGQPPANPLESS